ncbi:MAG: LicD family protein [Coriobacteriales bacterium]|nr:LicD family protein [Coriobacteriales bacterium]
MASIEERRPFSHAELQSVGQGILDAFDSYCKQYHLRYWLAFGTLLGAVRHQGFIPWDDDVDVIMPFEDYQRLIALHNEGLRLPSPFRLSASGLNNDQSNYNLFARIFDDRTELQRNYVRPRLAQGEGVWIDINCLCGCPQGAERAQIIQKLHRYHVMRDLSVYRFEISDDKNSSLLKRWIKTLARILLYIPSRLAGHRFWISRYERLMVDLPDFSQVPDCIVIPYTSPTYPSSLFGGTVPIIFAGREYPAPADYESLLEIIYDDYLQLPPEDERVPHDIEAYWRENA